MKWYPKSYLKSLTKSRMKFIVDFVNMIYILEISRIGKQFNCRWWYRWMAFVSILEDTLNFHPPRATKWALIRCGIDSFSSSIKSGSLSISNKRSQFQTTLLLIWRWHLLSITTSGKCIMITMTVSYQNLQLKKLLFHMKAMWGFYCQAIAHYGSTIQIYYDAFLLLWCGIELKL